MEYTVRPIQPCDNAAVEHLIRTCLVEFGGNRAGTAWADPDLGRFSEVYSAEKSRYWVAADAAGQIVAGTGIGPLPGTQAVCELQKMYCLPEVRGTGVSHRLMDTALAFARRFYDGCYLETLPNMKAAQRFYEKYGFQTVDVLPVPTAHFACDVRYFLPLKTDPSLTGNIFSSLHSL